MKFQIQYTDSDGKEQTETFNAIPEGAYAAMGIHDHTPAGSLFVKRLCRGGTSLLPLIDSNGNRAMVSAEYSGKTLIDGHWQDE